MTSDAFIVRLLPYALTTTSAVVAAAAMLCARYEQLQSAVTFFALCSVAFAALALWMLCNRDDQ